MQPLIRMYATATCPYCIRAEQLLLDKGVGGLDKIRVDLDPSRREEMMKLSGRRTVPQIFIGDYHVGGGMMEWQKAGQPVSRKRK